MWFGRDCGMTSDPKIQAVGDEHGAAGVLAVEELLAMAKLAEDGGAVQARYATLARRAFTTPKVARAAVLIAAAEGFLTIDHEDGRQVAARIAAYARWQVTDPGAAERQRRRRNGGPSQASTSRESHASVTPESRECHDSGRDCHGDVTPLQLTQRQKVGANAPTSVVSEVIERSNDRQDVEALCQRLADRIEANGSRRPTVTARWRDACRLLLDRDERTVEQIERVVDWCQADEFWRSNVLSMPKLRDQFDRLTLKAKASDAGAAMRNGATARDRAGQDMQALYAKAQQLKAVGQ
jgi:hypothetical protein